MKKLYKTIKISNSVQHRINFILKNNNENSTLFKKANIINTINNNNYKTISEACNTLNITKKTLYNHLNNFIKLDYSYFTEKKSKQNKLNTIATTIKKEFTRLPPKSYNEAKSRIKNLFQIDISIPQIRHFFQNNDIYTPKTKFTNKKKRILRNKKVLIIEKINSNKKITTLKTNLNNPIFSELDRLFIKWLDYDYIFEEKKSLKLRRKYGYRSYDDFDSLSYKQITGRIYYRYKKLEKVL